LSLSGKLEAAHFHGAMEKAPISPLKITASMHFLAGQTGNPVPTGAIRVVSRAGTRSSAWIPRSVGIQDGASDSDVPLAIPQG